MLANATMKRRIGNAMTISVSREISASMTPPKYPAIAPNNTPRNIDNTVAPIATSSEVCAP